MHAAHLPTTTGFVLLTLLACQPASPPSPVVSQQLSCARELLVSAGFRVYETQGEGLRAMRVGRDRFDDITVRSRRPDNSPSSLTVHALSGNVEGERLFLDQVGPSLEAGQLRAAIRDSCGVSTRGAEGVSGP
jgi:hypothetical protein